MGKNLSSVVDKISLSGSSLSSGQRYEMPPKNYKAYNEDCPDGNDNCDCYNGDCYCMDCNEGDD